MEAYRIKDHLTTSPLMTNTTHVITKSDGMRQNSIPAQPYIYL